MKKSVYAVILLAVIAILGYIGYQRVKTPLVSVVMLTYKRADIAPKAIESILAQTFDDYEFIILNDGSPDNTRDVINKYAKGDSRIKYYENDKNRGIAYSRNRVTSLARGKYIMIMDDDDESLPERMRLQLEFLEKNPEISAVAGQIVGLPRIPFNHDDIATGLIQYNNFGNSNVMYRKSHAQQYNISYDTTLKASEDWKFWVQMLFSGAKFAAISEDVLMRHGDSQKHYETTYEDQNQPIRDYISKFFTPKNPEIFNQASACDKLKLIEKAPVQIFSHDYLQNLLKINCR